MRRITTSTVPDDPFRWRGRPADEQTRQSIRAQQSERCLFLAMVAVLTVTEWVHWADHRLAGPYPAAVILALAVALAVPRIMAARRRLEDLRLGRDSEQAVGRMLESLRRHGYHVFHDVGDGVLCVGHVVIGPAGVFSVDTRTFGTSAKAAAVVAHSAAGLRRDGADLDDCLAHARAQARFVNYLLGEGTGTPYPVQPVVMFPDSVVEADGTESREVWVLEPPAFLSWIANRTDTLSPDQVRAARRVLSGRSHRPPTADVPGP